MYCFQDTTKYRLEITDFHTIHAFYAVVESCPGKLISMFSHFGTVPACD